MMDVFEPLIADKHFDKLNDNSSALIELHNKN